MEGIYAAWSLLTEPWALLAMAASFLYAVMNHYDTYLVKEVVGSEDEHDGVGILASVSGLFGFVTATSIALYAMFTGQSLIMEPTLVAQAAAVGALELVWLIPYLYATDRSGALESAPLFQSIPVFSLILGLLAFGEVPPVIQVVASITIVIGGGLLNLVPGSWQLEWKTIGQMLFASLVIALAYFIFKDTALEGNFVATVFWGGLSMGVTTAILLLVYRPYRRQFVSFLASPQRGKLKHQGVNEVLNALSVLLSQRAMMLGPSVMAVTALNAYQPVFVLLISWVLIKFGVGPNNTKLEGREAVKKTLAIALIALGTLLLA